MIVSHDRLLPKEDFEAAAVIEEQFLAEGISLFKNTKVDRVEIIDGKKCLWMEDKNIIVDEIIVATGRSPSVNSLNLEAASVTYDRQGVKVNQKLQTSNPKIYACGDVTGRYQFTHVAGYEASVVVQNALFFPSKKADYRVIPWTTFTDPELARVGLTEEEARKIYGQDIYVLKQDFAGVDRAQAEAATKGFAKIITNSQGYILGAHLVGSSAGELIHEIVLAMANNLKVSALSGIHVYPTLSEVNSKAALLFTKQKYAQNLRLQGFLSNLFKFFRHLARS
jgi:pyruvate/2-oxoglutarate dehydrogenase complex dihydrolipoamide dehydrogenase (E3) component